MSIDWRTTQAARDAAARRAALENVERAIVEVEGYLAEARDFEGFFSEQIGAVDRQISQIAVQYDGNSMTPVIVRRPNEAGVAEIERLRGVRGNLERERDAQKTAKTITSDGQFGQTSSHCLLSVGDMTSHLHRLKTIRDRVAEELRELEAKCSPGELLMAGVPAPDYEQYRRHAEELRYGPGVVVRSFGGAS